MEAFQQILAQAVKLGTRLLCFSLLMVSQRDAWAESEESSMVSVVANPGGFHEKRVGVSGWLHFRREDRAIYLSPAHADILDMPSAIWLDVDGERSNERAQSEANIESQLRAADGKAIYVEGMFDKDRKGHGDSFSGSIRSIDRVLERPTEQLRRQRAMPQAEKR